jgi:hypothetical protein
VGRKKKRNPVYIQKKHSKKEIEKEKHLIFQKCSQLPLRAVSTEATATASCPPLSKTLHAHALAATRCFNNNNNNCHNNSNTFPSTSR